MRDIITMLTGRKEFFWGLLVEHLEISLLAIVIAGVVGLILGTVISEYQKTSKITLGFINFIYTIPSISLLGFLIPFSGIGNTTAVIALAVYALLPMVRNTYTGITNIDKNLLEAAKGMGSTDWQILYKIKLPLATPVIMSGLRNMVTMTIALAGIASFIGAGGLGVAIYRGITTNNVAMTMTGSLLIAVLALVLDFVLGIAEKATQRHTVQNQKKRTLTIAVIVFACTTIAVSGFLGNSSDNTVHIATKPMTEQYILGEMLTELIEQDTNLKVQLTQGVGGGTSNIQPALEKGEFDLYPEYTGTGWNMVLKKDSLYDESMFGTLKSGYEDTMGLTWIGMYGFNNTYGLAVRKEIADEYGLKTYSDLAAVSGELTFGAEYDFFEREDGYDPLCAAYGFHFPNTIDLDIGLKYQAINENKIDVMNIFTTDGQLSVSQIVVLEDDKGFYPSYLCGTVVRMDVLEQYPELDSVFAKLDGVLSDGRIADMNYQVETEGKEPKDVAHAFLRDAGLVA